MKLVILDRDGVINQDSEAYIKTPAEWIALPGSLDAIARLTQAGFFIAVATNQSGIARGLFDLATLGAMHTKMHDQVQQAGGRIDAVFFCPHNHDAHCQCRKPRPGMVMDILKRFKASAHDVVMVGDKLGDLQAAHAAGCRSALVHTGYGTLTAKKHADEIRQIGALEFADLSEAAAWLCANEQG
jgi:D-glycero-D-manno-heptose 1,7-bisphosphate phosphatase